MSQAEVAVSSSTGLSLWSCMLAFAPWEHAVTEAAGCKWLAVKISVLPVTFVKVSWIPGCTGGGGCLASVARRAPVKFLSFICRAQAQLWGSSAGSVWGHFLGSCSQNLKSIAQQMELPGKLRECFQS